MFSFEESTENQVLFFRQTGFPVTSEWWASTLGKACYETGYFLFNYSVWKNLLICVDNEGHRRRIFVLVTETSLDLILSCLRRKGSLSYGPPSDRV